MNKRHWISDSDRLETRCGVLLFAMVILGACARFDPVALDPVASQDLARDAAASSTASTSEPMIRRSSNDLRSALDNPNRLSSDRARDSGRQADRVLAFFGIQPGMTVLDLYSGGGYYTELLSYVVGSSGHVVAHNNSVYQRFSRAEIEERYGDDRLSNVERILGENNQLDLPPNAFDAVLMTLAYHDVYFVNQDMGWIRIDGPALLAEVFQSMRPGAVLGIVDHVADSGAPATTGGTLHRLDPELIKRHLVAAGFLFDGESDVLRNFSDDHAQPVFDDSIRGRTDRAVLKFRKPVN
jgi:predicted methyltransferase